VLGPEAFRRDGATRCVSASSPGGGGSSRGSARIIGGISPLRWPGSKASFDEPNGLTNEQ